MSSCFKEIKNIHLKPSGISTNCASESDEKKYKIIGFSVIMMSVAGYYQWFFGNVVYRSGQNQMYHLGSSGVWLNYWEKYDFNEADIRKSAFSK